VRIKVRRKDKCWSVRLVYDSMELSEVMTARLGVTGVLQWRQSGIGSGAQEREGCACGSRELKKERAACAQPVVGADFYGLGVAEAVVGWRQWNKAGRGGDWRRTGGNDV
jgi:hypothetical protein